MGKRTADFVISATDDTKNGIASVKSGLNSLAGSFGSFGKIATGALAAIGVGFSIHGVVDMIHHANELTDAMRDTSQRIGIGIGDLQVFQLAAGNAGISTDKLEGLIRKMNKAVGEIKINESSKEVVGAFQRIGISVAQVKSSNPADIFQKVIEGLGKIQDPAVQSATALKIFGKSGADALTLVHDGAEGIKVASDAINGMGLALTQVDADKVDAANDALGTLSTVTEAAKQKLGAELAPAIEAAANLLLDTGKKGGDMGQHIHEGVGMAVTALDRVILAVQVLDNSWEAGEYAVIGAFEKMGGAVLNFAAVLLNGIGGDGPRALNYFISAANEGLTNLKQSFADFGISAANSVISAMNRAGEGTTNFFNKAIGQINGLIEKSNQFGHTNFDLVPTINWKGFDLKPAEAVKPVEIPMVPIWADGAIQAIKSQSDSLHSLGDANFDFAREAGDKAGDAMNKLLGDGGDLQAGFDKLGDSAKGAADKIGGGDYSGGGGIPAAADKAAKAVHDKVGKMAKEFSLLQEYGQAVTKGLEKSIDDFTKTGKIDFKEFSATILQEIAAITLKAAILGDILGNSKFGGNGSILGTGSNSFWGQAISGYLSGFSGVPKATIATSADLAGTGWAQSFDGGGFTGLGSRSGGIDGKGGFPAVLHPNETVVDHTRGQTLGGGDTHVHQTIMIREVMPAGQARAIQQAAVSASVGQMTSIQKRGGRRRKDVFGR
jgi:hypothetical protein